MLETTRRLEAFCEASILANPWPTRSGAWISPWSMSSAGRETEVQRRTFRLVVTRSRMFRPSKSRVTVFLLNKGGLLQPGKFPLCRGSSWYLVCRLWCQVGDVDIEIARLIAGVDQDVVCGEGLQPFVFKSRDESQTALQAALSLEAVARCRQAAPGRILCRNPNHFPAHALD